MRVEIGTPVIIAGKSHPWCGSRGRVIDLSPGPFGMVKVQLVRDDGMNDHEVYVDSHDMVYDAHTCARCGSAKVHYRTKGLKCPTCD